jgi:hypothetical protein
MRIAVRKLLSCIAVCAAVGSTPLYAQTFVPAEDQALEEAAQEEIVPLADLIDTMTEAEINQMEEAAMETESLTFDVEQMIEAAVEEAVATGTVGPELTENAAAVVELVNANAEFFDFDILDEIADIIAEGEFTEAQIWQTLEGFNQLSDADKALVGQEAFEAVDSNALYQQVSAAGKTIIAEKMPLLLEDDDADDVVPPPPGT